jgi:coenzyme F420-reducing hydrogenase beta subunit
MNRAGQYEAVYDVLSASTSAPNELLEVCPLSGFGPNEDALAEPLFGKSCSHDNRIGYYRSCYAGHVAEGDFRLSGSSGGMVSWLAVELHRRRVVDATIHVRAKESTDGCHPLFEMAVSRSERDIRLGAKSRYYPVELSRVLRELKTRPGRYAVVGLPCFIKALRLLSRKDSVVRGRLAVFLGLVCGHLKSAGLTDSIAWQLDIPPGELASIDYRLKLPGLPTYDYGVAVTSTKNRDRLVTSRAKHLYGGYGWDTGLFKYSACDYCDDVLAETADVTFGDAWHRRYESDGGGASMVVTRDATLDAMIADAAAAGRLHLDRLDATAVAACQRGGLRHRRDGLAYRLFLKDCQQQWRPKRRVEPSSTGLTRRVQDIQKKRILIASLSHVALQAAIEQGDFRIFRTLMDPHLRAYQALCTTPLWRRLAQRAYGLGLKTFRRLAHGKE